MIKNLSILMMLALAFACGKEEETKTELEGTWAQACSSQRTGTLVVTGSDYTFTNKGFSDSGCTTQTSTSIQKGTLATGDAVETPAGAKKLDTTPSSQTMAPLDESTASSWNGMSLCGYNDWAAGVEKDIAGRTCGSSTNSANGTTDYSIYKIDGSNLFTGEDSGANDGTTEAKRHNTLSTDPMVKQ